MSSSLALGIDIGGTNIKLGLVSAEGELLEHAVHSTPQKRDCADVVRAISDAVRAIIARGHGHAAGVGLAAPGVVDLAGEVVVHAPNFPSWKNEPLRRAVQDALNLPVVLGNDVDAFGLGEHRWGAAVGLKNFVAAAVGTGVGGAIFIDGKLYRGAWGGAAELGFTVISDQGPTVAGCTGALEGFIGRHGFDDLVLQLFPTGAVPTPKRITELAEQGDPRARQVHTTIATRLATAAASWLHILNPEALVLGGGTLTGAMFFFTEFERLLRARALRTHTEHLKILPSKLGYYSGVLGAASLWFAAAE